MQQSSCPVDHISLLMDANGQIIALLHDSKTRYNSRLSVKITIEFSLFSFLINR